MTTTITAREKKLLLATGIIAVLFLLVQFGILPMVKAVQESKTELLQIEVERSKVQMKIASEATMRETYAAAKSNYEMQLLSYPTQMQNEEIDKQLTGLTVRSGLAPVMLSIGETVQPEGTITAEEQAAYDKKKEEKPETPPMENKVVFRISSVNMNLLGGEAAAKLLINEVGSTAMLKLARFVMRPVGEDGSVATGPQSISVIFELTMLEESKV